MTTSTTIQTDGTDSLSEFMNFQTKMIARFQQKI